MSAVRQFRAEGERPLKVPSPRPPPLFSPESAGARGAQCADLLGDYGPPAGDPCMTMPWAWHVSGSDNCKEARLRPGEKPRDGIRCDEDHQAFPILGTDYIWFIADQHNSMRQR